jgi:hypothetical protein
MVKYIGIIELVLVIRGAFVDGCGGNADGVKIVVNISRA